MKIKFIGVGAAFAKADFFHSNMLITASNGKRLLLDCGCDARFSLKEAGVHPDTVTDAIDAIYISHLHSDHIGGLEWLAFSTFFLKKQRRPSLFMEKNMMKEMWENSLKGGLSKTGRAEMNLEDYFETKPVEENGKFVWEDIHFKLVKMPHIKADTFSLYSHGLIIDNTKTKNRPVFVTTDTVFTPEIIREISPAVDLIFHDCETSSIKTYVHAHYEELRTLPKEIKSKMWLYHYQPEMNYDPVFDGFLGLIKKGQEFDF